MKKLKRRGKSRQRYRLAAVPKVHCLFCDRKIGRRRYVEITTLARFGQMLFAHASCDAKAAK